MSGRFRHRRPRDASGLRLVQRFRWAIAAPFLILAPAAAQPTLEVEQLACLPVEDNGVLEAKVEGDEAGSILRMYFRRLHEEVEDFYWVQMHSRGGGNYWGVFPKPGSERTSRRELEAADIDRELWAQWWRRKIEIESRDPNGDLDRDVIRQRAGVGAAEPRDWMSEFTDEQLEQFLSEMEYEPAEYFVAIYDGYGKRLAQSPTRVTPVRADCPSTMTASEAGLAANLVVGETANWQKGDQVFHWLCDGVVSRVGPDGVWRGDDLCRACVIGWDRRPDYFLPLAAGVSVPDSSILDNPPPPEVSVSRPSADSP